MCTDLLERWGRGETLSRTFWVVLGTNVGPWWNISRAIPLAHMGVGNQGRRRGQVIKSEPVLDGPAKSSNAVCPLYRWENGGIERGHEGPSKLHGTSVPHQGG